MNLLVTGFEPFDGDDYNPSKEILENLKEAYGDIILHKMLLDVNFEVADEVIKMIEEKDIDVVISLGLAKNRKKVSVEMLGVNYMNAKIADNKGRICTNEMVNPNGPSSYFSTIDVYNIVDELEKNGLDIEVSLSAGAYVCNYLLYSLLDYACASNKALKAGFIHVPFSDQERSTLIIEEIIKRMK